MADSSSSVPYSTGEADEAFDLFISHAAKLPVKRARGYTDLDPDQVVEDLSRVLSPHLGRRPDVLAPQRDEKTDRRMLRIPEASVFLALVDDEYFQSELCMEELDRAFHFSRKSETLQIVALNLGNAGLSDIGRSSVRGHVAINQGNSYPLASSDPSASAREQEAEYRDNLNHAAALIARIIREPGTSRDQTAAAKPQAPPQGDPIWLVQYKASEARSFQERLKPGLIDTWRISPLAAETLQDEMSIGDWVAIWRTVEGKDRGGIIGWAKVSSLDPLERDQFELEVVEAFADDPVGRDEILSRLGDKPSNWPGVISLKRLDTGEATAFAGYLPADSGAETRQIEVEDEVETPLCDDSPETTRDLLRRAPLAFALAHKINDIWEEQNPPGSRKVEGSAFILHVDAPWGGGKTTFANYISRFLNPTAFGIKPGKHFRTIPDSIFHDIEWHKDSVWPQRFRDRKWITVEFNAWRHQHVTPPWWDLYEVIRKTCLERISNPLKRTWRWLREMSWRVATPKFWTRVTVFLTTIVLAAILYYQVQDNENREPLGLKDEETLLSVIVAFIVGGSGWALIGAIRDATSEIVASAGESTDAENLGTSDPLRRFRRHFGECIADYDHPVMVVIDDLDRCDSDYVVELVRGLLTVFQSPRVVFVLLGDKHWIETAFAQEYSVMEDANRDPNVSFGGRFAEKAIQMSFVLPEANRDERNLYVERLLLGDQGGDEKARIEWRRKREERINRELDQAETLNAKQQVLERATKELTFQPDNPDMDVVFDAEMLSILNSRKVIYTAAASEKQDKEIRKHALAPLKEMLPVNPRRIKRLVNMIAIYQASGQAALGIEPRSREWKQMVLWVVLMSEYPAHWRLLCSNPRLADYLSNKIDLPEGHSEDEALEKLGHPAVRRLIFGLPFDDDDAEDRDGPIEPGEYALTGEAVRDLRRLTPTH